VLFSAVDTTRRIGAAVMPAPANCAVLEAAIANEVRSRVGLGAGYREEKKEQRDARGKDAKHEPRI